MLYYVILCHAMMYYAIPIPVGPKEDPILAGLGGGTYPSVLHIYVCVYVYNHVYICMYVCMYIYIYIYNPHLGLINAPQAHSQKRLSGDVWRFLQEHNKLTLEETRLH